ncbi:hemerythrin-like domain-containing protein [Bradyrhizobium sp. i1.8.4]|uniref:hemerythrin domain-containing protein n=1 Tax=unclassified Bradyrhizobium TaxID=2631580 RepID=UPI003D2602E6
MRNFRAPSSAGKLRRKTSNFSFGDLAQMTESLLAYIVPPWSTAMIIDLLLREHRNIDLLLVALQRELEIFEHGIRPDYEVIRAIISYFEVYPEMYHHPQEDLIFSKLKTRDPDAAAMVGDLAHEHQEVIDRLHQCSRAIDGVLANREVLRQDVGTIVRDFIARERHHMMREERDFFPAALEALSAHDWTEVASALTDHGDPLFSETAEATSDALRAHILQLEQEAEAERSSVAFSSAMAGNPRHGAATDGPY